ncbi:MAG: hypothetical protein ACOCRK_01360 [bacterium]
MKRVAMNKKIISLSNKVAKAIEAEAEEILLHAEKVIKDFVPARKVKSTLKAIEAALENEGVESLFNYKITREALRKTASEEVTKEELDEVKAAVVAAIVAEFEDVLEDADDVADEVIGKFHPKHRFEVESKLKKSIEANLASKGIYCKLARNAKKPVTKKASKKKTLLEKIKASK